MRTIARPDIRLGSLALLLPIILAGCDVPTFEGPQIQSPPPAFFLQPASYQQQRMFPDHEITYHDAWVETSDGLYSGIYINGHAGVLTRDDVVAAQDAAKSRAELPVTFEPVEGLTIDGREAWGWAERLQTPERGLDWIAYRVIVPYDTMTYAIEFYGGEPGLKGEPDTLKVIVSSFAIGKTTWNLPLIAVIVGLSLFLVSFLRGRSDEKAARLQGITLKQIPKEELERLKAEKAGGKSPGATPNAPTGGSSIADAVRAAGHAKPPQPPKPPTENS